MELGHPETLVNNIDCYFDADLQLETLKKGLNKLLESVGNRNPKNQNPSSLIDADEFMSLYTLVYNLYFHIVKEYSENVPFIHIEYRHFEQQLSDIYDLVIRNHIQAKVLLSLREKNGEDFLREFAKGWSDHVILVYWLARIFNIVDRFNANNIRYYSRKEVGYLCFYNLVYLETKEQVQSAVFYLINREREGDKIDREFIRSAVNVLVELKGPRRNLIETDFEPALLQQTAEYYSAKSSDWIARLSYSDYTHKVNDCFASEASRTADYLHPIRVDIFLKKVRNELLDVHADKLADMMEGPDINN